MIVVADTGPPNYPIVIDAVGVLEPLYGCVVVPRSVEAELPHPDAAALVRTWIGHPPVWFEVHDDPRSDPTLGFLDAGERAALALAERLCADELPIDERAGGKEAERRALTVTGTLGVLAAADIEGLLDFDVAMARLRATNFRLDPELEASIRKRIATEKAE